LAKVSKSVYRAFQANVTVARGFVELHFIIEDLLKRGGEKTVGNLMRFGKRMMRIAGISLKKIERLMEEQLSQEAEKKEKRIGKEELERRAKQAAEEMIPELKSLFERIKPVAVAYQRGLLEQALVVTVSALETYFYDVTVEVIANNKYLRDTYTSKLQDNFRYSHLVNAHGDVAIALGEVIADSYSFYDVKSVHKHLKALLRGPTPLDSKTVQKWFINLLAYRNLIAHNAGIVDKEFIQKTGYKGKVGTPIRIRRVFVSDCIKIAEELVASMQHRLEKLRA
jgi:DNA-binding transcriptional MerR regulator